MESLHFIAFCVIFAYIGANCCYRSECCGEGLKANCSEPNEDQGRDRPCKEGNCKKSNQEMKMRSEVKDGRCDGGRILHRKSDGTYCCSFEIICPAGFVPKVCDGDNNTTCMPCPTGTFMPVELSSVSDYHKCFTSRSCPETDGFLIDFQGNSTADKSCLCNLELNYFDIDYGVEDSSRPYFCLRKTCPKNTELKANGTCQRCKSGYVKLGNGHGRCVPDSTNFTVALIGAVVTFIVLCACFLIWRGLCRVADLEDERVTSRQYYPHADGAVQEKNGMRNV